MLNRFRVNSTADPAHVLAVTRWGSSGQEAHAVDISILIPCFHTRPFLADALESIDRQRNLPKKLKIEVVLVADGESADGAFVRELVATRLAPFPFTIVLIELRQNVGAGLARYHGWLHCRGALVAFLDDDDVWHPDKLALQRDLHVRYPHQIATAHLYSDGSEPLHLSSGSLCGPSLTSVTFGELLVRSKAATPSLMLRRALWPSGPEPFRLGEDSLMTLMIADEQPLLLLPLVLASRSPAAPPILRDTHGLSRQRLGNRVAQWRNYILLVRRGKLSPLWLPMLIAVSIALAGRRWVLDLCARVRPIDKITDRLGVRRQNKFDTMARPGDIAPASAIHP